MGFMKGYRAPGTTELMFHQPFKVVEVVLIPYSNAGKKSIKIKLLVGVPYLS